MSAIAALNTGWHVPSRHFPWRSALGLFLALVLLSPLAADSSDKPTGGWRLAKASSPYLLLHASNPVEWYPWGEAAFAKAKAENKPLFISIGYFTCHWCHVMERESFRNPEIAQLLKRGFIAIKIDREQRPDLDSAYMSFVLATRGHGGWPMTVLATPDGTPFFGGSYFPAESHDGYDGLKQLLPKISEMWKQDRGRLVETSRQAVEQLKRQADPPNPLTEWTNAPVESARRWFREEYDQFHGGFGFAPKFPQSPQLLFLLQDEDRHSVEMALHTLDQMAAGGIHDQLAGGFHRYATDPAWRVPHFEKMLYDQALITRAYLAAFRRTGDKPYAEVARKTINFVLEHMRAPAGGFYSALDADSTVSGTSPPRREEGAYYIWDGAQLQAAIVDAERRQWVAARYGLKFDDSNADDDGPRELSEKKAPYIARTVEELAQDFQVDVATARQRLVVADRLLLTARQRRPAPPVDDKIVTAWNGFMITALVEAAQLLDDARYQDAAEAASRFVLKTLYDSERKILYRDWREGRRGVAGFCEDYAAVTEGFLALYGLNGDKRWLDAAQKLTDTQIEKFWDPQAGGFYSAGPDARLWMREKTAADNVTPSANTLSVANLLRLGSLTGDKRYTEKAVRTSAWQGGKLREAPVSMSYALAQWPALMAQQRAKDNSKDR